MVPRSILITGASSGIGAALARREAGPGVRLVLWARDARRLAAVADDCRSLGAGCRTACFDLSDTDRLAAELLAADDEAPLDLAYLNAGLGGSLPSAPAGQERQAILAMSAVNFTAPVVAANLLADRMAARHRGRIVVVASVAAAFPLPMAPLYSASKAGLVVFAEALGLRLAGAGVGVTVVLPGFVDTPMSRALREPRPFLVSAETAAAIIVRKANAGARRIVLPWPFAVLVGLSALLPRRLLLFTLGIINSKYSVSAQPPDG
jgi:short-subunit dehydrogenase